MHIIKAYFKSKLPQQSYAERRAKYTAFELLCVHELLSNVHMMNTLNTINTLLYVHESLSNVHMINTLYIKQGGGVGGGFRGGLRDGFQVVFISLQETGHESQ